MAPLAPPGYATVSYRALYSDLIEPFTSGYIAKQAIVCRTSHELFFWAF